MKKTFIIIILLASLTFCACAVNAPYTETVTVPATETETAAALPASTEAPAETEAPTEAPSPAPAREDFLILTDNGQRVAPFICPLYSTHYVEPSDTSSGGFLHGDSEEFFDYRLRIEGGLPTVGPGFAYSLGEDCSLSVINVYSAASKERLESGISEARMRELAASSDEPLIIEIWVQHNGRFIEAENDREHEAFSYAFTVEPAGN